MVRAREVAFMYSGFAASAKFACLMRYSMFSSLPSVNEISV
jgi:hypothetical protein